MSKFSSYNEELGINCVDDTEVYAVREKMKDYIPSLEDEYLDKFVIVKSKLLYVGTDEKELEIANRLGIGGGGESSDTEATVKEIQKIVDGVVELKDSFESQIPSSDTDKLNNPENTNSNNGIIGTRLFDRSDLNLVNGTWNILIEYDRENKETARYGTGYYWLKKGKDYTIGDETLNFKNDYVIDYKSKEFTVLSGRAVNWNVNATLGVTENVALNLDPMSLANGTWKKSTTEKDEVNEEYFEDFIVKNTDNTEVNTGIQKVGDVVYDKTNKALKFNKSDDNETGEGGYLRLKKMGLDFKNGFTFEIFANVDRFSYYSDMSKTVQGSLFCRTPSLTVSDYTSAMRFGFQDSMFVGKFFQGISWVGEGKNMKTTSDGAIKTLPDICKSNEDFYLTFVYIDYVKDKECDAYDEFMKNNNLDKVECYLNSELYGFSYYLPDTYDNGLRVWNLDSCPFYVGACVYSGVSNIFYLKGSVYSTRLYTSSLTPDQVKLNYDMTLKYRDSFKND